MLRWTGILATLALTATTAMAQTPAERPPEQRPEPAAAEMTFLGEVVSVDATAKTVLVKEASASSPSTPPAQSGKTMTFTIDSATKIMSKADMAGKALELKDLKAGERVTVKYTTSGAKHLAKSIDVGPSAT